MVAHERHITVTREGEVTISGLPVRPGQRVRVMVAIEEQDGGDAGREGALEGGLALRMGEFFRRVQSLPQVRQLSDEDIAREIERYRQSRSP